jgi:hypothetical protein
MNKLKVFLGGTCNESKWRDELIKMIDVDYFNPVVEDWTEECMTIEREQREICDISLYVITPRMSGVFAIAEVIDDVHRKGGRTWFCFLKKDWIYPAWNPSEGNIAEHIEFGKGQVKSLEQVSELITRRNGLVFESLEEIAETLNNLPPRDAKMTVCDECGRACCWHGEFMCDRADSAGTREETLVNLIASNREHPSHFSC